MALLPSPSCSTLPPHSPSSLASWAHSLVLGCREKLIPPTSHQGRAPARQDPPLPGAHQGGARTTGKGTPLEWGWKVQLVRPQPSLLTSLLSDGNGRDECCVASGASGPSPFSSDQVSVSPL